MGCRGRRGTYNPLPKALHDCDRRKCTSGGAEVLRRCWAARFEGVQSYPQDVGASVSNKTPTRPMEAKQDTGAGWMVCREARAAGLDRHRGRTRAVRDGR